MNRLSENLLTDDIVTTLVAGLVRNLTITHLGSVLPWIGMLHQCYTHCWIWVLVCGGRRLISQQN
jgi:hypothetical protein